MRRLIIITSATIAAAGLATVPAVAGLTDNPSFSHQLQVRVPEQARPVTLFDDSSRSTTPPTVSPRASRTPEPGDDRGAPNGDRSTEPGDDRGSDSAGATAGSGTSEPGDDRGSLGTEPGDDHGGDRGATTTAGTPSVSSNSGPGSSSSGNDGSGGGGSSSGSDDRGRHGSDG
ncbi:MAG: hypothetical protein QOE97_1450 [Pseudonocardiales bacterium]|jgi:hypothetical protein|nr:hypothetical protein [Pseudonocardiales bacterium]